MAGASKHATSRPRPTLHSAAADLPAGEPRLGESCKKSSLYAASPRAFLCVNSPLLTRLRQQRVPIGEVVAAFIRRWSC
jgi:hypothetical protein